MRSIVSTLLLVMTLEDLLRTANSFVVNPSVHVVRVRVGSPRLLHYREVSPRQWDSLVKPLGGLRMASDVQVDDAPKPRRQRRKRKDSLVDTTELTAERTAAAAASVDPVQSSKNPFVPGSPIARPVVVRSSSAVQLEVVDVRDVVAGRPSSMAASPSTSPLQDDPQRSRIDSTSSAAKSTSTQARKRSDDDDAFARLLRDAQQMQQAESDDVAGGKSSSPEFSLPNAAKSAISTLITVDFFLICGFLLWFLAGIFASTVLKDDAIQIAFNGIFQPVVQPALGVLMIGSIASAVFKGEDEDAGSSR